LDAGERPPLREEPLDFEFLATNAGRFVPVDFSRTDRAIG